MNKMVKARHRSTTGTSTICQHPTPAAIIDSWRLAIATINFDNLVDGTQLSLDSLFRGKEATSRSTTASAGTDATSGSTAASAGTETASGYSVESAENSGTTATFSIAAATPGSTVARHIVVRVYDAQCSASLQHKTHFTPTPIPTPTPTPTPTPKRKEQRSKRKRNLSRQTPREGHEFTSPRPRNTRDQQGSNAWALHHDRDASPYNKMD